MDGTVGTVSTTRALSVAILAMGGEGGGVLADWLVDLAEHAGWRVQATSVPGVAQRTGATIYYLELMPAVPGREPVFALMPVPGDVDVVVASELMEAARAVQRGLVTPDRTTFVVSTNRVFAMTEKIAPTDGRADSATLLEPCVKAAKRLIAADMAAITEATGSVISAALFGALAGSAALPFQREAFEQAIRRGGIGVDRSLAAFAQGFAAAEGAAPLTSPRSAGRGRIAEGDPGEGLRTESRPGSAPLAEAPPVGSPGQATGPAPHPDRPSGPIRPLPALRGEVTRDRIVREFPAAAHDVLILGADRLIDYQDPAYAALYLDRLAPIRDLDAAHGDGGHRLLTETARHLALGMAYEDTIRVAELKIRASRFDRVRREVKAADHQVLRIAEFMHPRVEEIADTLPAGAGRWLLATPWARGLVGRFTRKGRVVRTSTISGFLLLAAVASRKPKRRATLRFFAEDAHLTRWLDYVAATAAQDYALACELAECLTLVKGYGDTHARGRRNFETLVALLPALSARPDGAAALAGLRKAALADDTGAALADAISALYGEVSTRTPAVAHAH